MSDIPVSSVVKVTISTSPTFPSRKGFGTLNVVGSSTVIGVQERARFYSTIDGVGADFATTAEEYKAANAHFAQNPSPDRVLISRRIILDIAAEIRGGGNPLTVVATWAAIADGGFKTTIDGYAVDLTAALDFSSPAVTTLDGVAALIQSTIRALNAAVDAVNVTYNAAEGRFYILSGTVGATSTIVFATAPDSGTDISGTNFLEVDSGNATRINGIDVEDMADSLNAIEDANSDWYGLVVTSEVRDVEADIVAAAGWAESRIKVFGNDSDDNDILDSVTTTDIASVLKTANYRRTMTCYNSVVGEYLAVSILARAFVVNFAAPNSTLTLKFKQAPTITTAELTPAQKIALDGKNANAFYSVGGNPMFGESFMANGAFFDSVHGIDWLQNAIETEVFGKLYTDITKTAQTDGGVATLQERTESALSEGRNNGLLAPGFDRNGNFLSKGYLTVAGKVADQNSSDRAERKGPPITFTALGAGAIHSIEINGNFEE